MSSRDNTAVTRRLAAIVIADVVGYSRLMERDDTGTFSRLRNIRDEVVDPAIVSYDGRIVKTAGDGLLAEFPSALAALRASVQIQREMAKRNEGVATDERIDYRIGVNLGDIMVDGSDIVGDGVNVASRLEALAEPGGICVSGSVREQVRGQLDVEFVDIGEQQVKNIERPLRVYRVVVKRKDGQLAVASRNRKWQRRPWLIAGSLLAAIAMAAIGFMAVRGLVATKAAPPLSIAVIPFGVSGSGVDDKLTSDEITQEVITALARSKRSARVSSYPLVAGYKGDTVDAKAVGRALNVRYVVVGEVRIDKDSATVVTRLDDAATAEQLDTYTSKLADVGASDRDTLIIARAASDIRTAMGRAERKRARETRADTDLDLLARASAIWQADNYSLGAAREALKIVDDVLKRDPNNVAALVRRYWMLNTLYEDDLHSDRDRIVREMDAATSRAVAIDPRDAEAWHARAIAFGWQGRSAEAEEALAEARRLDPNNPTYLEQRTHLLLISGQLDEVKSITDQVIKRSGTLGEREYRDLCWVELADGHHAAAVPYCEKAAALSDWWLDEMFLTSAYAQTGQTVKASAARDRLVKHQPDITIDLLRKHRYSNHPDYLRWEEADLFAGLRKAGIPEK